MSNNSFGQLRYISLACVPFRDSYCRRDASVCFYHSNCLFNKRAKFNPRLFHVALMENIMPSFCSFSHNFFFSNKARHASTNSARDRRVFNGDSFWDLTSLFRLRYRNSFLKDHIHQKRCKQFSHKSINVYCSKVLLALASATLR